MLTGLAGRRQSEILLEVQAGSWRPSAFNAAEVVGLFLTTADPELLPFLHSWDAEHDDDCKADVEDTEVDAADEQDGASSIVPSPDPVLIDDELAVPPQLLPTVRRVPLSPIVKASSESIPDDLQVVLLSWLGQWLVCPELGPRSSGDGVRQAEDPVKIPLDSEGHFVVVVVVDTDWEQEGAAFPDDEVVAAAGGPPCSSGKVPTAGRGLRS